MSLTDLPTWIDEVTGPGFIWYVKRLSGNDTLANGTHQAGPYVPKTVLFDIFPSLNRPTVLNPEKWFEVRVDSHPAVQQVRAIWYNNKVSGNGTRDETRLTNFGGGTSALLDPESTGALTVFAFLRGDDGEGIRCHIWVCRDTVEEDLIEDRTGVIEPGQWSVWVPAQPALILPPGKANRPCWLTPAQIPSAWLTVFPTGAEIIGEAIRKQPLSEMPPDVRLVKRRECEFDIFQSIEEAVELPRIRQGFASMDEFINYANSIMQRRKSRSGNSLELHLHHIFLEEGLQPDINFSYRPVSEADKKPDFLFPCQSAYKDSGFSAANLRMLAVKTTCKDRWRQILNEADRIPEKHLFTLQEGISEKQFQEMTTAGVKLVVPARLISSYRNSIQPHLQTLESFIADIRLLPSC